jgi:hypothetical protein
MRTLFSSPAIASSLTRSLDLPAGACMSMHLAQGAELFCEAGNLELVMPPLWIAERILSRSSQLDEGSHCMLPEAGWMTLRAGQHGARVQLLESAPRWSQLAVAARAMLASVAQCVQQLWQRTRRTALRIQMR